MTPQCAGSEVCELLTGSTWASPSVETAGHHFPSTGFSRDHMIEFKRIRDARISDSVVETNRLVIRLEKVG